MCMPANLPPNYFEAEQRYREGKTPEAKIEALEEMLTIMPKHKGTDKLRADLRRRIAKLKVSVQQKKGGPRRDTAYQIEREGAAQVAVVGAPNTGKSSLVAALSNASPEVADFPHTTWKPTPGMVPYENIQFQFIDTPPVTREYLDQYMVDIMRRADILLLLVDLHADPIQQFEETMDVLKSVRIFPESSPIPSDLKKPPFRKKIVVGVNKVDGAFGIDDYQAFLELSEVKVPCVWFSIKEGANLHSLLQLLYETAQIIRVYTKAPGKEPNRKEPFILPKNSTLEELAGKIHKDFVRKLKFAKIWGKAVYEGQMVQRDYVLQDGDVVEIHI